MKKAIYTIMLGHEPMFAYTHKAMSLYAQRIGADLIVRRERLSGLIDEDKSVNLLTASAEKFFIEDLLGTYERVLYLDADVLIAPHAPDIFAKYPDSQHFYGLDESLAIDHSEEIDSLCKLLNYQGEWKKHKNHPLYFNSGVMLVSQPNTFLAAKKADEFRQVYRHSLHADHLYFNYLLQKTQTSTQRLDPRFNWMENMGAAAERFNAYFIHYADGAYTQGEMPKAERIAQDFALLYGEEENSNLSQEIAETRSSELEGMSRPILQSGNNILKRSRHGFMLYNENDAYLGRCLHHYGEFSEGEVELFKQIVRPGHVVLDIGANIGAHTAYFSKAVGAQGAVLAFEPQRIIYQMLCANMALNGLENVHCYMAALGGERGEISVPKVDYAQHGNFGGLSIGGQHGERVPLWRLDDLKLDRCHFLKIDVEGMEQMVLSGATETLARHKPCLYVENDRQNKSADLIRFIDAQGYRMYWHLPRLAVANNYFHNRQRVFNKNIVSINMLCIHQDMQQDIQGLHEVKGPDDNWRDYLAKR